MADFAEVQTPDMNDPHEGPGLPPAVPRLMTALAAGLAVLVIPYALTPLVSDVTEDTSIIEAISDYRAWWPGDKLPFSGHFRTSRPAPSVVVASVTGVDGDPDIGELGLAPIVVSAEPAPTTRNDISPDTSHSSGNHGGPDAVDSDAKPSPSNTPPDAQDAVPPAPKVHPYTRIKIPEATWEGLEAFIVDPNNAMRHAYDKLAKVALKEPDAMMRISHFGDSAIAADGMPSSTRRHLQRVFGDGGHGFSLVAASNNWYRRKDVEWTSRNFRTEVFISDDAKDRRYGFGGTAAIGGGGARASWKTITVKDPLELDKTSGTRASRFGIHYLAQKNGGRITLMVDGAEHTVIETASETPEDRTAQIEVEDGPHTFELRVSGGRAKIYGAIIERSSGVVVDGLGIIGARDTRWANYDPDHVKWAFGARDLDLAVFMYGGNQLEDNVTMAAYKERLTPIVKLWRDALGPDRSCLLMSPIDHGERHRGRVRTVPRQLDIMKVQQEVAQEQGCAWFSLYDAMGGDGSIGKWFEQGLAEGDLAHPTSKGAIVLGKLFYQALMKGLHDHLGKVISDHDKGAAP